MENAYRNTGFFMSALLVCVALGFYKTYFGTFPKYFFSISGLVHFHAAVAVTWVLMLIAQPLMIRSGRTQAHRALGKFSYVLFPILLLSALLLLFYVWLRGDRAILFAGIADGLLLLIFYILAIKNRKKTPAHARYMIATGLVLLDPTLGRAAVLLFEWPPVWGNHLPFLTTDAILLALIFWDWKNHRNFKPWLVVLSCFLVYQTATYTLFASSSNTATSDSTSSFSMDLAKIENAEITAWLDLFGAQPDAFHREQGSESARVDGVFLNTCQQIPFPHFNLALDLGVGKPFSEQTLDHILSHFKMKGIGKFYLQITPVTQPTGAAEWLTVRGLRHVSSWHRIARSNAPLGEALNISKKYTVEEVAAENAQVWANFIDEVYGMPTGPWLLELVNRPGWTHVVCRDEAGKIIAARSMKINPDSTAYFLIDAPVPGIMTQNFEADYLLARRLVEIGLAKGVQLFTSDIEKPSLTQDTPAYKFWSALGFEVAYEKKNFMF